MKLSVIIVSYNVQYFLEKCLVSVFRALNGIEGEVIVIDNHSVDQSVELIRERFPGVILIPNAENVGFGKACNQGLRICKGEYALLLNPDTLVSEETFGKCIAFMDAHPEASSCGVRMVDGTGTELPESMRGLPTPWSAFFKMTGLSAVFPDSSFFNGYYLGGKSRKEVQAVPVLTGAFMFMRMEAIHQVGMLDEDYFMYGEDIDLCYRMIQGGFQNYYLPEPTIIHYKGESTHRDRLRYVMHFYKAMLIYVRKHIGGIGGSIFRILIVLGVVVRGLLGAVRRIVQQVTPILIDGVVIAAVILGVTQLWARIYFQDTDHFSGTFYRVNLPLYTILWLLFLFLSGAHDTQRSVRRILYGMFIGTLVILIVYAILPLDLRSSRAVILISAAVIAFVLAIGQAIRLALGRLRKRSRRTAIIGSRSEVNRIMEILNRVEMPNQIVGWIAVNAEDTGPHLLGHISQVREIVEGNAVGELVFSQDIAFREINALMSQMGPSVAYRISSTGSEQIVGSDSKKEQGTLYTASVRFALAYPMHRRLKRLLDVTVCLILIFISPLLLIAGGARGRFRANLFSVLRGKRTWVGYALPDQQLRELPELKPGILTCGGARIPLEESEMHMINYIYAREYQIWKDIDIILRYFSEISR